MITTALSLPLILLAAFGMIVMLIVLFKALRGRTAIGLLAIALIGMAGLLLLRGANTRRHVPVWPQIVQAQADKARLRDRLNKPPRAPEVEELTALDTMEERMSELADRGAETAQKIAHGAYEMAVTQQERLLGDETVVTELTDTGACATVRHTSSRSDADRDRRTNILHGILTAVEIAAFLCVAYVFLDGATRGQFTWALRLVSVVAFAAIYVALTSLRHQL